jgi:hypothetical protein
LAVISVNIGGRKNGNFLAAELFLGFRKWSGRYRTDPETLKDFPATEAAKPSSERGDAGSAPSQQAGPEFTL